jgi:transposase
MEDATIARAVAMRAEGRSVREIAVALKIPRATITRALAASCQTRRALGGAQ